MRAKDPHTLSFIGQFHWHEPFAYRGFAKRVVSKGWFWRMFLDPHNRNEGTTKKGATVPKKRNEGAKNGTTVQKTRTRVHSPKQPFYKPALAFPLEHRPSACAADMVGNFKQHYYFSVVRYNPAGLPRRDYAPTEQTARGPIVGKVAVALL